MKIARVTSVPISILSYRHLYEHLQESGYDVSIIATPDEKYHLLEEMNVSNILPLKIKREISPFFDLISLVKLFVLFKKQNFTIVHSQTPKAGLITAMAAFLARVPYRLHTFTGQRWATLSGGKRSLLIFCDKIISKLNTSCFADSPSQVKFLVESGIIASEKINCIGKGSFAGIDLGKFDYLALQSYRDRLRKDHNIEQTAVVFAYMGRIVGDKGINELVKAFLQALRINEKCFLFLIGDFEDALDPIENELREEIDSNSKIIHISYTLEPEKKLMMADVFCLPSYREGFGSVVLEAAALKIPSIVTDIVGLKDAVIDGETGVLIKPCDVDSLRDVMLELLEDEAKRVRMGDAAYTFTIENFSADKVLSETVHMYDELLKGRI